MSRKARAERSVVCLLRILIFLLPTIRVCLTRVRGRKWSGSVCTIGVVAWRVVRVEVVLLGFDSGRCGGDQEVRDGLGL